MQGNSPRNALVLVVDDDPDDQEMIKMAMEECKLPTRVIALTDGEELIDYLQDVSKAIPDMILLDINMPRMNGHEALKFIKEHEQYKTLPVVMLTTSKAQTDVIKSYQLGCNSFISKPLLYPTLVDLMNMLREYWVETVEHAEIQRIIDHHLTTGQ